jgi:cytidine deaminase
MAATSNEKLGKGEFTYPCHMCKQLMYESSRRSGLPMEIILFNEFGEEETLMLSDMISHPWPK